MSMTIEVDKAWRRRARLRQYAAATIAPTTSVSVNLSTFSVGNMFGWTSPMQPLLSSPTPPVGTTPLSPEQISWLGSVNFIGALVGAFFWGLSSDRLGRKRTSMLVAIPFIVSWTLKLSAQNIWWLLFARLIIGFGCSGVIINVPTYVAEMAEDDIRGSLGSFLIIFLNAGCVFSYVVGTVATYHKFVFACLCVPTIHAVLVSFLPESPVYLCIQGNRDEAEKSLLWLRGGDALKTAKELESLKVKQIKDLQNPSFKSLFDSKGVRKAMVISVSFMVGQQFSGMLAMLTYTVKIFEEAGSSLSANNSAIIIGFLQLPSALLSFLLIDRAGRKSLLISSFVSMAISLTVLGSYFYLKNDSCSPVYRWIPIICLSVNVIAYSVGIGPVPFVVMSEIFPPNIRGFAASRVQLIGTLLSFSSVKTFPLLTSNLGYHGCFLFYAFVCAILSVFTLVIVPETKGEAIEDILKKLNGEVSNRVDDNKYPELVGMGTAEVKEELRR